MFVDTSGIYCLYNRDQNDHEGAVNYYFSAHRRVTTNYVLAEYVALADTRGSSRRDAIDLSQKILDDEEIELVWVDEDLHRQAVRLLANREDKTYSLCDAVSFLIMRSFGISDALTTDRHFKQEGFVRLLKPWMAMNDPRQLGESITDVYFESNHITNADKLALMHGAMSDPLFLADIEEINEDFR